LGLFIGTLIALLAAGPATAGPFDTRDDTLQEKEFDQLSSRQISDWGRLALQINPDDWRHGETKHFVIHYQKRGQKVATRCESFYEQIRGFFGNRADLKGDEKSHVFAFHEFGDWRQFTAAVHLGGFAGLTRDDEFFYAAADYGGHFEHQGRVQAHEMTHLVFNRFFRGQLPLWLNEGVAEYFGQRETSSTTEFRRLMGMAPEFDLDQLFAAGRYPDDPAGLRAFYAEAAIVVDFLSHTQDRQALLPKFVEQMTKQHDLAAALRLYEYPDLEAFRAAYARYRRRF